MKNFVFHDLFELRFYGSKHEKKSLAQYHVLQFNSHYIKRIIVKNFFKKWNVKVRKENSVIQKGDLKISIKTMSIELGMKPLARIAQLLLLGRIQE